MKQAFKSEDNSMHLSYRMRIPVIDKQFTENSRIAHGKNAQRLQYGQACTVQRHVRFLIYFSKLLITFNLIKERLRCYCWS